MRKRQGNSPEREELHRQPRTNSTHAKRLRRDETDCERKLWMHLRARQINGLKFRRQQPVGRYIVDFFCPESQLVIELDGGQHADQVQADQHRTEFLNRSGYRVLRFWDNDVLNNIESVLQRIAEALGSPSPCPLPPGERALKRSQPFLPSVSPARSKKVEQNYPSPPPSPSRGEGVVRRSGR